MKLLRSRTFRSGSPRSFGMARIFLLTALVCSCTFAVSAASASAATPAFTLSTSSLPRHLPPGLGKAKWCCSS
jgi:hypothetical protein